MPGASGLATSGGTGRRGSCGLPTRSWWSSSTLHLGASRHQWLTCTCISVLIFLNQPDLLSGPCLTRSAWSVSSFTPHLKFRRFIVSFSGFRRDTFQAVWCLHAWAKLWSVWWCRAAGQRVQCLAGAPLLAADGLVLGCLAVVGSMPRQLSPAQSAYFSRLAGAPLLLVCLDQYALLFAILYISATAVETMSLSSWGLVRQCYIIGWKEFQS